MVDQHREGGRVSQDYIELLIVGADGIRRKFVGYGELIEVDNLEFHHTQMIVVNYVAPIIDLTTGNEVACLRLGDPVSVYTHVRRPHHGTPHRLIAAGEWQGFCIPESALERVLPDTKPSLSVEAEEDTSA